MSDDETYSIVCGKCRVTPEHGFKTDDQPWAYCPKCGQEDTIADIKREAAEYYADKAIRGAFAFSGRVTTVTSPPDRSYRWITGCQAQ